MSYVQSPATTTVTATGQPVEWLVDWDNKTVTPMVDGVALGTWRNRLAAMAELGLVEVAKGKRT